MDPLIAKPPYGLSLAMTDIEVQGGGHPTCLMQKLLAARRHQMNTQGKTDIPAPQAPTPHPGYALHAELHAIKRHAVELMNQKEQESPSLRKSFS
ncbi:hypothetical protein OUZ56_016515 [Daphnia magna]|uniref:Uncharacterized protein n=1 Tax=Daphnia magna TaxID=35525 RepID=A0ABR0AQR9_9CRUS|nr:hypothetical protein OUZ56_016515 [Daphnia magna]